MSFHDIARQRLRTQRLTGRPFDRMEDAIRWLGATQAQDYHGAKWGLAQRSGGAADHAATGIDRALADATIVRTHVLRPTWHLVPAEDIRWLLALTAPRVHAVNAFMYRQTGLDDETLRRTRAIIVEALEGGRYLTRPELAAGLADVGISASGMRLAHLIMHAELDAVIVNGPIRGKQHTYALMDERVPPLETIDRDAALARLTHRFFAGHGPATVHDLSWWSGLSLADCRRGIDIEGPSLAQRAVDDATFWFDRDQDISPTDESTVHLLPNYDEHLIGYKERRPTVDPAAYRTEPPSDAFDRNLVVFDGRVVGGWRRTLSSRLVTVEATLYVEPDEAQRAALLEAAERYRAFTGSESLSMRVRTPSD